MTTASNFKSTSLTLARPLASLARASVVLIAASFVAPGMTAPRCYRSLTPLLTAQRPRSGTAAECRPEDDPPGRHRMDGVVDEAPGSSSEWWKVSRVGPDRLGLPPAFATARPEWTGQLTVASSPSLPRHRRQPLS